MMGLSKLEQFAVEARQVLMHGDREITCAVEAQRLS